tara:strand:+ start:1765 stop:2508 length:744 start_codon:yes stop_codon:yes gene_type:complete
MENLLEKIDGSEGFYDALVLSNNDIKELKQIVREHFFSQLILKYPELENEIENTEMYDYHKLLDKNPKMDHSFLGLKKNRILPYKHAKKFRSLNFFRELESELGPLKITNEENIYEEEIYWRLTRPGHNDVGPLHADKWFWDLGHGHMPSDYRRIKIWISIYNEMGLNGLRYVKGSHLKDWPYHGEKRDGFTKPMIDVKDDELEITKFLSTSGMAFIFNDKLLHGGFSGGINSRVSIECTLMMKKIN